MECGFYVALVGEGRIIRPMENTPTTILSKDGRHKATVTATDDGASADYYRSVIGQGRGLPVEQEIPMTWRFLRSASIRQPFHQALDTAHDIVNTL